MFVSHAESLARFRSAIERSDATAAWLAAAGMEVLSRHDALQLCHALAKTRDPRYDRAARRWVGLLAAERDTNLGDVAVAATALLALGVDPASGRALEALEALCRWREA